MARPSQHHLLASSGDDTAILLAEERFLRHIHEKSRFDDAGNVDKLVVERYWLCLPGRKIEYDVKDEVAIVSDNWPRLLDSHS